MVATELLLRLTEGGLLATEGWGWLLLCRLRFLVAWHCVVGLSIAWHTVEVLGRALGSLALGGLRGEGVERWLLLRLVRAHRQIREQRIKILVRLHLQKRRLVHFLPALILFAFGEIKLLLLHHIKIKQPTEICLLSLSRRSGRLKRSKAILSLHLVHLCLLGLIRRHVHAAEQTTGRLGVCHRLRAELLLLLLCPWLLLRLWHVELLRLYRLLLSGVEIAELWLLLLNWLWLPLAELVWLDLVELGLVVELWLLAILIGLDLSKLLVGLRLPELLLIELGLLRLLVNVKRLLLLHLWLGLLHRLLLAHERECIWLLHGVHLLEVVLLRLLGRAEVQTTEEIHTGRLLLLRLGLALHEGESSALLLDRRLGC